MNLQEAEAALANLQVQRAELGRGLADLEAEQEAFQEAKSLDVASVPADQVRAAVTQATRAAVEGPALVASIKEFRRRIAAADGEIVNAQQRLGMARADEASRQVAALLLGSKDVASMVALLDRCQALWPSSWSGLQPLLGKVTETKRNLAELVDLARQMAG